MKKFFTFILLVSLVTSNAQASWLSEAWKGVEKGWKDTVEVVVDGVTRAFGSLSEALAHLDSEILKVRKKTIVLDDQYWKKQAQKVEDIDVSESLVQFNKDFNQLKKDISLENLDKLDDNFEIGGTTGEMWEKGKDWVQERFADSGPRGPRLMKDRPFIGPIRKMSETTFNFLTLISNNNNTWLSDRMNELLAGTLEVDDNGQVKYCTEETSGQEAGPGNDTRPKFSFCVIGADQFFREEFNKAGIVCPRELFDLAKAGVPGVHLERVDEVEWCRMANQHHADRFHEGYERTRHRAACVAEWSLRRFDDWLSKIPPLFKCVDIRAKMIAEREAALAVKDELYQEFIEQYDKEIAELEEAIIEHEIEIAKEQAEESASKIERYEESITRDIQIIQENLPNYQASKVPLSSQIEFFSHQLTETNKLVEDHLAEVVNSESSSCDSSIQETNISLRKSIAKLLANSRRIASLLEQVESDEKSRETVYGGIGKGDTISAMFEDASTKLKTLTGDCTELLQTPVSLAEYSKRVSSFREKGYFSSALRIIDEAIKNNPSLERNESLESLKKDRDTLFQFGLKSSVPFKSLIEELKQTASKLDSNERQIFEHMLVVGSGYDPISGEFSYPATFKTREDVSNFELKLRAAKEVYNVFN